MKMLGKTTIIGIVLASTLTSYAQLVTYSFDFNIDPAYQSIPDGEPNGITALVDTKTVSGVGGPIQDMAVRLNITGDPLAFNGDYFVRLRNVNSGAFAVLLNRPGVPAENGGRGYSDNGMNIVLRDFVGGQPAPDIHTYQNVLGHIPQNPLTGTWAPDGRNADPREVTMDRNDPINQPLRTLSVFNNNNANGDWVLYVSDMAQGGQGKLVSWGLDFVAIPEPHQYVLIAGLALIGFAFYRKFNFEMA